MTRERLLLAPGPTADVVQQRQYLELLWNQMFAGWNEGFAPDRYELGRQLLMPPTDDARGGETPYTSLQTLGCWSSGWVLGCPCSELANGPVRVESRQVVYKL